MDKSPDAFRTISEVADWLGTPAHVLRFWESRFSQVKPVKRAGGRRYYRPSDMVLLGGIKKLLHDDGMTIRGVQKLLREHGVRYVASMSPHLDGVDPVEAPSESLGPVPSAPMAEDVPTGAFDAQPATPEEKILPFSRPDIPAQPAPNAAPTPPIADVASSAPVSEIEAPAPTDIPEAPMIDVDAPFDPIPEPIRQPEPTASDQLPLQIETPPEPARPAPSAAMAPSVDSASHPQSVPAESKPAQVPFDFNLDSAPIDQHKDDAITGLNDVGTPLMDDESFDSALQAALSSEDASVEDDLGFAAHAPAEPLDAQTDLPESTHLPDASELQNIDDMQAHQASSLDPAPEFVPPISDTQPEFAPDLAPAEAAVLSDSAATTFAFDTENAPDTNEIAEVSIPDSAPVAAVEFEAAPSIESIELDAPASISADTTVSQPQPDITPIADIPDDPEDSANGLNVVKGVLGQLNKKALSEADPHVVQAIFDRATALNAKLAQTG